MNILKMTVYGMEKCTNFTYICPAAESNDFFYVMHSIGYDATAHKSLLV